MSKKFKKIAIMARQREEPIADTLQALINYLLQRKLTPCLEEATAELLPSASIPAFPAEELSKHCDLIIVVGGDGSILNAARYAVNQDLPLLGINRGRLGFLTDIRPDELDKVGKVLDGEYKSEQRFMLEATLQQSDHTIVQPALNDVVLFPGAISNMIEFRVDIENQSVSHYRADGLIVATPTGSTAHALSAGGPILNPGLDAFTLVPMCSHTLSSRPLVVNANKEIVITVSENNEKPASVSCDGQKRTLIDQGKKIKINKHKKTLQLVHPIDYRYFETLRDKLHWKG